jgi:quercetin dioxygenase-like cupin family protein
LKIIHYKAIEPDIVEGPEVKGVNIRWLIGKDDAAPNFAMRILEVEPGGHSPLHTHDFEHEVFILEGQCSVWKQGEKIPVEPGTAVFVPPNEKHCFYNTGTVTLKFICVVPV